MAPVRPFHNLLPVFSFDPNMVLRLSGPEILRSEKPSRYLRRTILCLVLILIIFTFLKQGNAACPKAVLLVEG